MIEIQLNNILGPHRKWKLKGIQGEVAQWWMPFAEITPFSCWNLSNKLSIQQVFIILVVQWLCLKEHKLSIQQVIMAEIMSEIAQWWIPERR